MAGDEQDEMQQFEDAEESCTLRLEQIHFTDPFC